MFDHMRYRGGAVVPQSGAGEFTVEHLDLNDPDVIEWRKSFIRGLAIIAGAVKGARATVKDLLKLVNAAKSGKEKAARHAELNVAKNNLAKAEQVLKGLSG